MQYGLSLPNGGAWCSPLAYAALAQVAENSGWDGIFLEDYIVWQSHQDAPTHDPWILLAAMAMQTTRVKLGTQVTPLPRRRPWKVARELISLDHLSNGRIIFGAGVGDTGEAIQGDISFMKFGEVTSLRQRAEMLDEGLEILAGLFTGKPFHYEGKYYHIEEVTLLPPSVQQPRIPIWIGGGYPLKGPTRRAARWDGACMYKQGDFVMSPADIRDLRALVLEQRGSLDGYDIACGGTSRREDWEEERTYIRSLAEAGVTWWSEYIPPDSGDLDTVRSLIERGPLRID